MAKFNLELVLGFFVIISGVYSQENIVVERGESTTFTCSTDSDKRCSLHKGIYGSTPVDRTQQDDPRFSIKDAKSCIIEATSLGFNDSEKYNCDFGSGKIEYHLIVVATPQEPQLWYNGREVANNTKEPVTPNNPNSSVQFECRSNQGYPNATFSWYVDDNLQGDSNQIEAMEVNGLWNLVSRRSVFYDPAIYTLDGAIPGVKEKEVKCIVDHPSYTTSPKILIGHFGRSYATHAVQLLSRDKESQFELNSARGNEIFCSANGLPVPTEFIIKRKKDDNDDEYEVVSKETSFNVTQPGTYICDARNRDGNDNLWNEYKASDPFYVLDPDRAGRQTKKSDAGTIVGIVLGTIFAIAIVIGVVAYLYRREKMCFKQPAQRSHTQTQGNVENGVKNVYENEMTTNEKDVKKDGVKGDQNENTKPKEVVYAQLDLTKTNNGNVRPKSPEEKTEYAQLTFQPKENQV